MTTKKAKATLATYSILFKSHPARDYKDARAVLLALKRFANHTSPTAPKPTAVIESTWYRTARREFTPDEFSERSTELNRRAAIEKTEAKIEALKLELAALKTADEVIEDMGDDA